MMIFSSMGDSVSPNEENRSLENTLCGEMGASKLVSIILSYLLSP